MQQNSIEQMSMQQLPMQQMPMQQMPLQQMPMQQMPVQQMPLQQMPMQQMRAAPPKPGDAVACSQCGMDGYYPGKAAFLGFSVECVEKAPPCAFNPADSTWKGHKWEEIPMGALHMGFTISPEAKRRQAEEQGAIFVVTVSGKDHLVPLDFSETVQSMKDKVAAILNTDLAKVMIFAGGAQKYGPIRQWPESPEAHLKVGSLEELGCMPGHCLFVVDVGKLDEQLGHLIETGGQEGYKIRHRREGINAVELVLKELQADGTAGNFRIYRVGGWEEMGSIAVLMPDGSVLTYSADEPYVYPEVKDQLKNGVMSIYSTSAAFAALKSDGSVVAWGEPHSGGDFGFRDGEQDQQALKDIQKKLSGGVHSIRCAERSFAAIKENGSLIASWGTQPSEAEADAVLE